MKIACAATIICIAALASAQPAPPPPLPGWRQWIENFGHDTFVYEHVAHLGTLEPHPVAFRSPDLHLCGTFVRLYRYPDWVADQMAACVCSKVQPSGFQCLAGGKSLPAQPEELSFCVAKSYMLARMPTFDLHYLPPAVTVQGTSMLDDNIAFALLADAAAPFSKNIPLSLRLAYILPYASFHEPRNNWRPLFFSKYFNLSSHATTTIGAMQTLLPGAFRDWSGNPPLMKGASPPHSIASAESWTDASASTPDNWQIRWKSSTAPPVTGPFDFVAYGHGSCTAWSTLITYILRSVGVPARQVGTPCWNSAFGGTNFTGLALHNPNVTKCWHGSAKEGGKMVFGNDFLNNHNWVELWDDVLQQWVHVNTPPGSSTPNSGLCSWNVSTGCDYSNVTGCTHAGKLGQAMLDHPIFSPSWSLQGDIEGEEIVDVATLTLSNGEAVSPLVWAPNFKNAFGEPLAHDGLRMLNLTSQYRCHPPTPHVQQ
eukprot:gene11397-5596_t